MPLTGSARWSTKSLPDLARPLLRDLRAGLPAERAGDLGAAQRGGRRGRASRARVRGAARQLGRALDRRVPTLPRRAAAALLEPRRVRRRHRRLSRALRRAARAARGREAAARLQPADLAPRHARRRSEPLPGRAVHRARPLGRRPPGAAPPRPGRRRHRRERRLPRRARRAPSRARTGLPGRRRGPPLPCGLAPRRAVPRPLRRQADPVARSGDDPRGCAARSRARGPR